VSSGSVGTAARRLLAKAFARAQAARSRGDDKPVKLLLNEAQCPEFFAMRDLDDARQFRAELGAFERSGAIRFVLGKRMASPHDMTAIVVSDLDLLAAGLGLDVRSTQVQQAGKRLSPHLSTYPILDEVLERWRLGKMVRGAAPTSSSVDALLDAIKVRVERQGKADEVLLRRASSHLFNDSKRIEAVSRWLDLLAEGSLVSSGLTRHEIFASLGLHKEPQPFLIAANALVSNGRTDFGLLRPYTGLPTTAITAFHFDQAPAFVMTIENKSTFHEMAALAEATPACVIYSGGMPSPAWKRTYSKIIASLTGDVPLYHFGDLDVGGFRIARGIAEVAKTHGRGLKPWLMNPVVLTGMGYELRKAKAAQLSAMQRMCEQLGWNEIAAAIAQKPGLLEQEHVLLQLPG
jgi:hypothetical protein